MRRRRQTRGAALVFAMLVVALVATASASMQWKQWRSVEVEASERERVQSAWMLTGMLDWARLILRDDARISSNDHLGEAWARPLQAVDLGQFPESQADTGIGADNNSSISRGVLTGQITDMQSRLNAANLAALGKISQPSLRAFSRLFEVLGLPPAQLAQLAENMRLTSDFGAQGAARSRSPLGPQRLHELASLGLSKATLSMLEPHVTVLPSRTPVNLNTASAEVIYSVTDGISMADAQRLVDERKVSPLKTLVDAAKVLRRPDGSLRDNAAYSVTSRYFEVSAKWRLRHGASQFTVLVQRDGLDVVVMQRDRGNGLDF